MLVTFERDLADGVASELGREVKAMKGVEEKEGTDPVVEVVGFAAELIELFGFG